MHAEMRRSLVDNNSTNGRSLSPVPAPLRLGFRALSELWPRKAEEWGSWLFCHPKRAKVRLAEQKVLDAGHAFTLEVEGFRLAAWSWGDGPLILLHHGWGGRASQMTAFVEPLLQAGFGVVAYDAPAHGDSPGRITSGPEMARILRAVDRRFLGLHGVIAHSLGGAVTLLAIGDGFSPRAAVLLAAPSDLRGFTRIFAEHVGMNPDKVPGMGERAADRFDADWEEMHVGHWARGAHPPLLLFHDRRDEVLPVEEAHALHRAWPGSELTVTEGLGHRGIRRDPELRRRAVAWLGATLPDRSELRREAVASRD